MGKLASLLLVSALLLSWSTLLAAAEDNERFGLCHDGWIQYGDACYKFNSTAVDQHQARSTCMKHRWQQLVRINSDSDNIFAKGFLTNKSEGLWLGRVFYDRYFEEFQWYYSRPSEAKLTYSNGTLLPTYPPDSLDCVELRQDGQWLSVACDEKLPFLCQRPRQCRVGWTGRNCDSPCHCHQSDPCDQDTGVCPRGCLPGWTGSQCNTEHPLPKASFHCLKTPEQSLRVDMTVATHDRDYRIVRAVDERGQPLDCTLPELRKTSSGFYVSLALSDAFLDGSFNDSSSFNDSARSFDFNGTDYTTDDNGDDCVSSRSDNGTVTWLIEFKLFKNVSTGDDVTVEVTCDLNEADDVETLDSAFDDSVQEQPLTAAHKKIVTSVYFIDAHSQQRQDRFHFGQRLQLCIEAEGLTDQECIMPHDCFVRPDDGKGRDLHFLDQHGCAVRDSPVRQLEVVNHTVTSNAFPAFSLGSETVTLDCEVDVVYRGSLSDCSQICQYWKRR